MKNHSKIYGAALSCLIYGILTFTMFGAGIPDFVVNGCPSNNDPAKINVINVMVGDILSVGVGSIQGLDERYNTYEWAFSDSSCVKASYLLRDPYSSFKRTAPPTELTDDELKNATVRFFYFRKSKVDKGTGEVISEKLTVTVRNKQLRNKKITRTLSINVYSPSCDSLKIDQKYAKPFPSMLNPKKVGGYAFNYDVTLSVNNLSIDETTVRALGRRDNSGGTVGGSSGEVEGFGKLCLVQVSNEMYDGTSSEGLLSYSESLFGKEIHKAGGVDFAKTKMSYDYVSKWSISDSMTNERVCYTRSEDVVAYLMYNNLQGYNGGGTAWVPIAVSKWSVDGVANEANDGRWTMFLCTPRSLAWNPNDKRSLPLDFPSWDELVDKFK